jgi:threonine dehydrogenase-like Zn-dependent dehydrogenase
VAYGGICGSDLHYWMHGARRRVHPAGADGDIAAQKVVVDRVWEEGSP